MAFGNLSRLRSDVDTASGNYLLGILSFFRRRPLLAMRR
jgi:hypothetical protein